MYPVMWTLVRNSSTTVSNQKVGEEGLEPPTPCV